MLEFLDNVARRWHDWRFRSIHNDAKTVLEHLRELIDEKPQAHERSIVGTTSGVEEESPITPYAIDW